MKDLETALRETLSFALHNPHSDFYRRKYGASYAALLGKPAAEIPFLTREEIDFTPVLDRIFVPRELIRFIRASSGSTGRNVVGLPMVEVGLHDAYLQSINYTKSTGQLSRYFEPYFTQMNIRSLLLFSAGAFVHEARVRKTEGRLFISGEFSQPKLTAQLASEAQVESIVGNPSGLVDFAPYLKAAGGAPQVRLIISVGERPTELQLTLLSSIFQNAKIALQYGLTESQQGYVGYTCPERMGSDPKALHLAEGSMCMELIDPDTKESLPLAVGSEGELVVTTHEPLAFPLIRYRTGDFARIREEKCSCAGSPLLFECLGRLTLDRMKVPRGVLTIAAIDQAVGSMELPIQEFEAAWKVEGSLPGLQITLYMKDGSMEKSTLVSLAERIRISPTLTYKDITEAGLVRALECILKPAETWVGWKKKKRLR